MCALGETLYVSTGHGTFAIVPQSHIELPTDLQGAGQFQGMGFALMLLLFLLAKEELGGSEL